MNRRFKSSSIAEVLIAITVIALCFGIAALVIVRSLKTTSSYSEFKEQTLIQSEMVQMLIKDTIYDLEIDGLEEELLDGVMTRKYVNSDGKIIWQQELIEDGKKN